MAKSKGSKRVPPDIGLHMECTEEELEPSQVEYYQKAEKEFNEVQAKLNNYLKKMKAEVVEKGENCLVLQLNATPANASPATAQGATIGTGGKVTRQGVSTTQNFTPIVGQQIITRSATNASGNTYLVMDPRLGLVVGQMPPTSVNTDQTTTPKSIVTRSRPSVTTSSVSTSPLSVTTRARSGGKKPEAETLPPAPLTRTREKSRSQSQSPQPQLVQQQVFSSTPGSTGGKTYRIKANAKLQPPPSKPTENNALGGLSIGSKLPWKPTSDDAAKGSTADSREVTFNKLSGKTFPSLVVFARPHLRLKYIPQTTVNQERSSLDAKVKGVLMYTPTKFTEWLIQQGLIRSEQFCQTHVNNDLSPVSLKLGMYSDVTKFPYSGGYVWISECCPSQFVSVFSGSIFEGSPQSPMTLLKLIYHWACQTNVQNVVQWVKVDNLFVKNFFTNMRAVCTQAIHQKYQKIGGPRKKVEVGVISLGTTSQDGNMRQVKVEVLGVMDPESKQIRLRAVEPLAEERNFKRRFVKILEPLEEWVHKESSILTDFTVDKGTLNNMGFHSVYQVSITDPPSKYSNQNVMEYLRRIVPRMFQNTLSLLSRQIIQQFLDELVWRENWGPIASQAFVNIIAHLAEQTKLDVTDSLLTRLSKVSSNPFKNWNYSVWKPITTNLSNAKTQQATSAAAAANSPATGNLESLPLATRLELDPEADTPGKNLRTRKRTAEQASVAETPPPAAKKPIKIISKEKSAKKEEKSKPVEKPNNKKDGGEKVAEEVSSYINEEGNMIPLECFYYGTRQGDDEPIEKDATFSVKCCVCNKKFTDNIILMRHMILHCQTDPALTVDLKKVFQCNYCFLGFNNNSSLKTHLEETHFVVHNKVEHDFDCQICEEKFSDRPNLFYHMQKTHVEMELPYECGLCHYRTSIYKQFLDHFTQTHKGTPYVFCPFCLKMISVSHNGEAIAANVNFYVSHLERHQRKSLTKKCYRCQLSFIHKGILEQHLEADHCGFKYDYGVKPWPNTGEEMLMPEPNLLLARLAPPPKQAKNPKLKNMFVANKFKGLEFTGIEDGMECVECEGSMSWPEHFTGVMSCTKCRFTTCCERAVLEHVTIFHENSNSQFTMGKPIVLQQEMYCLCGYSSSSGNRLAKHIALCEKKTAYPNEESILAIQDREFDKEQERSGEGQNVLNTLGLVRKSPEDNSKKEGEDLTSDVEMKTLNESAEEEKPEISKADEKSETEISKAEEESELKISKTEADVEPLVSSSDKESEPQANSADLEPEPLTSSVGLESEQQANSADQEPEAQLSGADRESELQVSNVDQESEPQISSADQESEPQISSADQESEPQVSSAEQESEPQISNVDQESEPPIGSADLGSEPQISSADQELEPQIGSTDQESESQARNANEVSEPQVSCADPEPQVSKADEATEPQAEDLPEIKTPPNDSIENALPEPMEVDETDAELKSEKEEMGRAEEAMEVDETLPVEQSRENEDNDKNEETEALKESETEIETKAEVVDNTLNEAIESRESTTNENLINENIENDKIEETAAERSREEESIESGSVSVPERNTEVEENQSEAS